jgi:hypothetical protein
MGIIVTHGSKTLSEEEEEEDMKSGIVSRITTKEVTLETNRQIETPEGLR